MVETVFLETPLGIASIAGDEDGVTKISILEDRKEKISSEIPNVLLWFPNSSGLILAY